MAARLSTMDDAAELPGEHGADTTLRDRKGHSGPEPSDRPQIVISAGDWESGRPRLTVSRADLFAMIDQFDDVYSDAMSSRDDTQELANGQETGQQVSVP